MVSERQGNSWCDIGGFSFPDPSLEGIRRSRVRGLFEKAQASGFRKHATFAPAISVSLFCGGLRVEKTV